MLWASTQTVRRKDGDGALPSNLSTIGFDFAGEGDLTAILTRLAGEARERFSTPLGEYAIWRSRTGAELWFQLAPPMDDGAPEREIIGMTPFFEGESDIAVKVTAFVRRLEDTPLEGAFTAWVAPDEDGEGAYPLVFDAVDFAAHSGREIPAIRRVRLAGFAREITAFASEKTYFAAQDRKPAFAARSFVPVGMFAAAMDGEADETPPPSSAALLTGEVLEHQLLTNEETGRSFHWLLVESADATFDILADPEVVTGNIVFGGTVEVACLLLGRFLD